MEDKKFIKSFISQRDMGEDRESCLIIALQNARVLFRRDKEGNAFDIDICEKLDGIIEFEPFIGLVNYFLVLDIIGAIFTDKKDGVGIRIKEVLKIYGNMSEDEQKVISTLRNCLVHNYSLADKEKKIKFILDNSCEEMIKHPIKVWDGDYSIKNDDSTSTSINPKKLIDKIEEIYEKVKKEVICGKLNHKLENIEELKTRFTVKYE